MSIVYKDSSEITQADIKKDRLHAIQYKFGEYTIKISWFFDQDIYLGSACINTCLMVWVLKIILIVKVTPSVESNEK